MTEAGGWHISAQWSPALHLAFDAGSQVLGGSLPLWCPISLRLKGLAFVRLEGDSCEDDFITISWLPVILELFRYCCREREGLKEQNNKESA